MNFAAIIFWTSVGVLNFSEKSSSRMESKGTRKEDESSLEIGAYLSFLVYFGRVKPKNVPKGRVVKPKLGKPLFPFTSRVVSSVFGFRFSLSSKFFG